MRIVLGVIAGAVVGLLSIWGIYQLIHMAYPPPLGTDLNDPEEAARYMASAPAAALALVAAGWFIGALVGAWVACAVAKRALAGWIVALLVLAACVVVLTQIQGHPGWMWAAGILLPLIGGWLAQRLAKTPA